MCPSTRPEPISAPSSITSITDADCTPHSAINPRLSSKPNSAKSKPSERTQPKLCPSNPLSQTKGAVQHSTGDVPVFDPVSSSRPALQRSQAAVGDRFKPSDERR